MESSTKTARPYAIAAFRQAQEEGDTGRWSAMLSLLGAVTADPAMRGLIANPKVKRSELASLIIDVCGDGLTESGRNFVRVLAENRRLGIVGDIAAAYEAERANAEKRNEVVVVSARELSAEQENTLTAAMTKRLGTRVDLSVQVDPALIGGVVIRSGDTVIDASVRGRLTQLRQALA